jgi:hypothetical protein
LAYPLSRRRIPYEPELDLFRKPLLELLQHCFKRGKVWQLPQCFDKLFEAEACVVDEIAGKRFLGMST